MNLKQDEIDIWIAKFKRHFENQYPYIDVTANATISERQGSPRHKDFLTAANYYDNVHHDEVDQYLSERPKKVDNPLV